MRHSDPRHLDAWLDTLHALAGAATNARTARPRPAVAGQATARSASEVERRARPDAAAVRTRPLGTHGL